MSQPTADTWKDHVLVDWNWSDETIYGKEHRRAA